MATNASMSAPVTAYVVLTADGYINALEYKHADSSGAATLLILVLRTASGKTEALSALVQPDDYDLVLTITVPEENVLPRQPCEEPARTRAAIRRLFRARSVVRRACRLHNVTTVVGWNNEFFFRMVAAAAAPARLVYLDFGAKLLAERKKKRAGAKKKGPVTAEGWLREKLERIFCPPLSRAPAITYFTAYPEYVPPADRVEIIENRFAYHKAAYGRERLNGALTPEEAETCPDVIIVGHTQFTALPYEAMLRQARGIAGDEARLAYYMHPREADPPPGFVKACRHCGIAVMRDDRPLELAFLSGTARRCRTLVVTHYTTALSFLRQVIGTEVQVCFLLSEKHKLGRATKMKSAIDRFIETDPNVRAYLVDGEKGPSPTQPNHQEQPTT